MGWLAALLVTCIGCVVVPKTITTERVLENGVVETPQKRRDPELSIVRIGQTLRVTLVAPRTCTVEHYTLVETTESTRGSVESLGDPKPGRELSGMLLVAALDIVIFPISGIVTGIVVEVSGTTTTTERRVAFHYDHPCPLPMPRTRVTLRLPSGQELAAETDKLGRADLALPADEPPTGIVRAEAEGAKPVSFRY